MARWRLALGFSVCCLGLAGALAAQEPAPLATPTARLDHLLSLWRGQTVAHLREVWGREQETEMRGRNPVLLYEKRVKVRAILGGVAVHPNGGLRCVVRFEISEADEVLRVTRQGGGQECWNQWRRYEP